MFRPTQTGSTILAVIAVVIALAFAVTQTRENLAKKTWWDPGCGQFHVGVYSQPLGPGYKHVWECDEHCPACAELEFYAGLGQY